MSGFRLSFPACAIAGKTRLSADDVATLRKYTFPNGVLCSQHVSTLLVLNNCCPEKSPEWQSYFIESLAQFALHHCYPQGSLDELNAEWIEGVLATDGIVNSSLELDALLHIIDLSASVPPSLSGLALDQLYHAVRDGTGPLNSIRPNADLGIGVEEMSYVFRILRNEFTDGLLPLARRQISALLRIGKVVANRQNVPEWQDLLETIRLRENLPLGHFHALRLAARAATLHRHKP